MQAGQLRVRGVDGAENTPCPGLAEHVGSQNWAWVMEAVDDWKSDQHGWELPSWGF